MKRGTPRNPKVSHLCELLNIQLYEAVGILELIWHFTAEFAPRGDIGRHSDKAIAMAVGWQRPSGAKGVTPECRLRDALVEAKWLDSDPVHRLVVHDWSDHLDQSVERKLARLKLAVVKPMTSLPEPLPEPCLKPEPVPDATPPSVALRAKGGFHLDELYSNFREACTWLGLIPSDFLGDAWWEWGRLDVSQRQQAISGIKALEEAGVDPSLVKRPKKYLQDQEWLRGAPRPKLTKVDHLRSNVLRRLKDAGH